MSNIGERIVATAIEILNRNPNGVRYADLVSQVERSDGSLEHHSVVGTVVALPQEHRDQVYKPSRGLYRLAKYRDEGTGRPKAEPVSVEAAAFALTVTRTDSDPEVDRLLDRVRTSPSDDRRKALDALVQSAQRQNDPDVWNSAGIGFHLAGLHDQATRIFNSLVQSAPENDTYRLNLATSLSQTAQVELCRFHLRHVADDGSTEEDRHFAKEQLRQYEDFLGVSEHEQDRRESQIASLRQSIGKPGAAVEDYLGLARLLHHCAMLEAKGDWLAEEASVLEKGLANHPSEPRLLELLIECYLRHDPHNRLDTVAARLKEVAPHSRVLEVLAGVTDESARDFVKQNSQRTQDLLGVVCDKNSTSTAREAALNDLGRIVTMYPDNPDYRVTYAFALMAANRKDAALAQARCLTSLPIRTHSFHFNLGQVFWSCGDAEHGRHHLDLAMQYAENDQEREDVRERISDLERK